MIQPTVQSSIDSSIKLFSNIFHEESTGRKLKTPLSVMVLREILQKYFSLNEIL